MIKEIKREKLLKRSKILIFVFSGLAILGITFFVFYFYVYKTPEKIFRNMQEKMSQVKAFRYKGEIDATGNSGGNGSEMRFNIEGDSDGTGKEENNYLKIGMDGSLGILRLDAEAELMILDRDLYFKVSKIPSVLGAYGDFSSILNRWIKTEISKQENTNNLNDIIKNANLLKSIKKLKSEKVENTDTYHYQIVPEINNLKDLVDSQAMLSFFTPGEVAKFKEDINLLPDIVLEVWIGKKDNYLYKIKGTIPAATKFSFSVILSKFNQPVNLKAPEKTEPLEQVFGSFWDAFQKLKTIPGS